VTVVAIDTNVLAYAEDTNGLEMKTAALHLLEKLSPDSTVIPVQALGELFTVLVKKARRSREAAQAAVLSWGDTFPLIDTSPAILVSAMTLATQHQLGWWDAIILAAAADARCRLLLSEDLQNGFTWSGVTVANPFAGFRHPLLAALLK
jgi:predicted nucleic acid-binding protein